MSSRQQLSNWQVGIIVLAVGMCMTPLGFHPTQMLVGRQIWLVVLLQILVSMAMGLGSYLVLRTEVRGGFGAAAITGFGPVWGRLYLGAFALFFLTFSPVANAPHIFDILKATSLSYTNSYLIAGIYVLIVGLGAYLGIEAIARTGELWAFLWVPLVVLSALIVYKDADYSHLLPLAGNVRHWLGHPDVWAFAAGNRGAIIPLALMRVLPERPRLGALCFGVPFLASVLIGLFYIAPQVIFHQETIATFQFPAIEALDTIDARAFGVQSMLGVALTIWTVISWILSATVLWVAVDLIAQLFGLTAPRRLVVPCAVLVAIADGYPKSQTFGDLVLYGWSGAGYLLAIALPLLLALCIWRGRGRPQSSGG